jgi:hypothetical protein
MPSSRRKHAPAGQGAAPGFGASAGARGQPLLSLSRSSRLSTVPSGLRETDEQHVVGGQAGALDGGGAHRHPVNGLVTHDTLTGHEERYRFDKGVFCSEVGVAPRVGGTDEDESLARRR